MGVYENDYEVCEFCDGTGGTCVDGECWECNGKGYIGGADACIVCGMPSSQGCDCKDERDGQAFYLGICDGCAQSLNECLCHV